MQACSLLFARPLFTANARHQLLCRRRSRLSIPGHTMSSVHCFCPVCTYEVILPARFYSHLLPHFCISLHSYPPVSSFFNLLFAAFLFLSHIFPSIAGFPTVLIIFLSLMGGPVHTGFRWGNLRKRDQLEDLVVDGRVIVKWILRSRLRAWTGLVWLRTRTSGGLL